MNGEARGYAQPETIVVEGKPPDSGNARGAGLDIGKSEENQMPQSSIGRCSSCLVLLSVVWIGANRAASHTQPISYLKLATPSQVLQDSQPWEGDEFPHSLSVLELNLCGYRYWGWYGLNGGRGIGLARSNDLVQWTKYEKNPVLTNARWPSALEKADPGHPEVLYFAITRDYDSPSSYVVLATSTNGIEITQKKVLVEPVPNQRSQNPNLFHDPQSGRFYLTYYRGRAKDCFEIVSRGAANIEDLDTAPEKVLIRSEEIIAAPTLLYVKNAKGKKNGKPSGLYYLSTEVFPEAEWLVKVYYADAPDGDFQPVMGNPVLRGQRGCMFQHIFDGRFYGYNCHLDRAGHWTLEEVEAPLP